MYLWFSINVDEYYKDIKFDVNRVKEELGINYGTNNLPYHISLKISFEAPKGKEEDIINEVEAFYKTLKPFNIKSIGIAYQSQILWVRYEENDYIRYIINELNEMLNKKYNIPYHLFDINFIFHTTLFMNNDPYILKEGYLKLKDLNWPQELYLNKFLIGYSPSGLPETYSVIKEIVLKN